MSALEPDKLAKRLFKSKGVTQTAPPGCFHGWCHPGVGPRDGSLEPPEHPGGCAL
jgi:hypothetical protein